MQVHIGPEPAFERPALQAVGYLDTTRLSPYAAMPRSVCSAHPRNKEKSYRYFLKKLASDLCILQLRNERGVCCCQCAIGTAHPEEEEGDGIRVKGSHLKTYLIRLFKRS